MTISIFGSVPLVHLSFGKGKEQSRIKERHFIDKRKGKGGQYREKIQVELWSERLNLG